ncbi:flagellar biosynthesis protein FlhF [Tepidicella baoligensis]|uniref:flagellar biosynthesis protein FlhF n=1 Tax=Tepidicella baoligensis TaxID=2707016 RepID=UPI0015DB60C7|nr:flagellar biosynthesis protein FlhF [Tepidicella baoligensis]
MNAQRFIAPNSREALAQAKAAFGDSAVILSSRSTEQGFEVVATAEEHLAQLATQVANPGSSTAPRGRMTLEQRAARQLPRLSPKSSVAQDTEMLAMSTLSFQDYVRERMLRKRREALQGEGDAGKARGTDRAEMAPPPARHGGAVAQDGDMVLPFARGQQEARGSAAAKTRSPAGAVPADVPSKTAAPAPVGARLAEQIDSLKALMEERFTTLAWMGQAKQSPIQSTLLLKLVRSGYSPTVARAVMERLPERYGAAEAFRWTQEVLARNLRTSRDAGQLCDEGGVFALVGSTGVGKTTTAAKLAAQCVQAYGANSIGLITLDTYRVAGYEQLRAYGRMLGVVAHLAHDRAALQDLLELLANKRMVIIDTAGLGQKDPRIQEMMELLAAPSIKKLLVLNAGAHGDTLDDVVQAYQGTPLHGVVLTKIDEAAKLGPAVDTLIRHQLVLRGLSTGQRVPEDWKRPDALALVRLSMASGGKSAYDPQSSELPLFFTDTARGRVELDGRHA